MSLTPQEMLKKLKGPLALLPTHFNKDESLDLEAMRATAEFARDQIMGKDGCIMITGSTSEFYAMTDEESLAVLDTVVKTVDGKVPVIAGTGRAGTKLAIDMSLKAQDKGIDLAMITNPYYLQCTDEGLYRHFSKIAEALKIGVMIYNNPTTSKMWTPVSVMQRLSMIPNIIASKENTTVMERIYWMMDAINPEEFTVCCGIGNLYYLYEAILNCKAYVTELVCFAPQIAYAMYDMACQKNYSELKKQLDRLIPYHKFIGACVSRRNIPTVLCEEVGGRATAVYQSVMKKAMELTGLPGGVVREPLENLTDTETAELKDILKDIGLI
jgi:4-hydroxy-tetrahydrodipicolinate synthase